MHMFQHQIKHIRIFGFLLMLLLLLTLPAAVMQPIAQATAPSSSIEIANTADQILMLGTNNSGFGNAVAISSDWLAVGAIYASMNGVTAGAVHLYQRDAQSIHGWTELRTLHRDPPSSFGAFGEALALQGDILVVGVPRDPRNTGGFWQGAVYVYERNHGGSNAWGLVTQLADEEDGRFRQFGRSVAIDGDLVAVGVQGANDSQGKVFLYSRSAGWQRIQTIVDPNGKPGDEFGSAVALAGDTLVVGAQTGDASSTLTDTGAAFVFKHDQGATGQWGLVTQLVADVPGVDSFFGDSVMIDGDTIVVGAYNEHVVANGQLIASQVGAAYVFERSQGGLEVWNLAAALRPADGRTLDKYGSSLALAGNDLWIGSPGSNAGGFDSQGILHHYQRNLAGSNTWEALPQIEADQGSKLHAFGTSMAIDGNTLIASAPGYNQTGAVYAIELTDTPNSISNTAFLPLILHDVVAATGILVDGGSIQDITGAIIGAVPGTLDSPVEATIRTVLPPAFALPSGFVQRGNYYQISARSRAIAPADKPLLVGLPVPQGADPAKLAVAALISNGYASGELKPESPADSWSELPGSYDATTNLFVTTIRTLLPEHVTLVLFEHHSNQPLPSATTAQIQQAGAVAYSVACAPASPSLDACNADNYRLLETELEAAHNLFANTHGFQPPALVHLAGVFLGPNKTPQLREVYYNVVVHTAPCVNQAGEPFDGKYHWVTLRLVVCMNPQATVDDIQKTVRHELFHAIQAAYPNVAKDFFTPETYDLTLWTLEGTAVAAERSSFLMLRSPDFLLRAASEPLTSTEKLYKYSTQDFWVYTGIEGTQANHYIEYLKPIFEKGATPEHVNEAIPLANAYWEWAKNQVIEHHQPMIDAFVNGSCQLENRTIDPASIKFLIYPSASQAAGTLLPLTSALVQIEVQQAREIMSVLASNSTDDQDLRYKVYGQDEAGCKVIPDGRRTLFSVSSESTIFVLVSNVSLSQPFDFVVEVD